MERARRKVLEIVAQCEHRLNRPAPSGQKGTDLWVSASGSECLRPAARPVFYLSFITLRQPLARLGPKLVLRPAANGQPDVTTALQQN